MFIANSAKTNNPLNLTYFIIFFIYQSIIIGLFYSGYYSIAILYVHDHLELINSQYFLAMSTVSIFEVLRAGCYQYWVSFRLCLAMGDCFICLMVDLKSLCCRINIRPCYCFALHWIWSIFIILFLAFSYYCHYLLLFTVSQLMVCECQIMLL